MTTLVPPRRAVIPSVAVLPDNVRTRILGRVALALALSASLLLPAGAAQAQSDEEKAAARSLATQGADALKNNKFGEALDLVGRAEAIVHAPTHLLMIARAQVGLGKLVAARETYLKLMREELAPSAPTAFKNAQGAAKDELAAIDPKIASLRIVLDALGQKKVTVKMDEQQVPPALIGVHRPVDPGQHEVSVFPVGGSPVKATVMLRDGEKKDVRLLVPDVVAAGVPLNPVDNPDAPKPGPDAQPPRDTGGGGFMTPIRGAGIGVGVVGIGGVVVGALFMAKSGSSGSKADDLFDKCGSKCTAGQKSEIQQLDKDAASQKTIGVIGLVAGGVALAGGVTMLIVGKPKAAPAPAKASIEPWFGGASAGLRGQF